MYDKIDDYNQTRLIDIKRLDQKWADLSAKIFQDSKDTSQTLSTVKKHDNELILMNNKINDFIENLNDQKSFTISKISESSDLIFKDLSIMNDKISKLNINDNRYKIDFCNIK